MGADFASFVVLAVLLAVTPGADTMVVLKNAASGGARSGIWTTLGVKTGTVVHAILAGAGIAAVLVQFSAFYALMKTVGAAYLVGLGVYSVYRAFVGNGQVTEERVSPIKSDRRCFIEGLLSNLLNPKVVLFYVAVLPQFVLPENVLVTSVKLASVHIGASLCWLVLVSIFVGSAKKWLARPRVRTVVNALSGAAIAAFGVRLALSRQ
jgi:threonine/homoserine/homoserine lactone efflux protein